MKIAIIVLLIALIGIGIGGFFYWQSQSEEREKISEINIKNMEIKSPEFNNEGPIPPKYTCDSDNISPPLEISGTPNEAKSLVLIVDDPDASSGTWMHWSVWNIDPQTESIAEGKLPNAAVEGATSFGEIGYGGPCPPSGEHHYVFKIFALDKGIWLESGASRSELEKEMEGHVIAKGELIGLYSREK